MSRPSAISTQASHVAARIGGRPLLAVQRARQNPRRRRLADAARAGEDERLREPPARERVAQRPRHRLLSDDVVEPLRPPLARDDLVGHEVRMLNAMFETVRSCRVRIALRIEPRPGGPAAHVRIYLALLPSGPDAVRRLKLHRFRTAIRRIRSDQCTCGSARDQAAAWGSE